MRPHLVILALALVAAALAAPPADADHRPQQVTYVAGWPASSPGGSAQCTSTGVASPVVVTGACFLDAPALLTVLIEVTDNVHQANIGFTYTGVTNGGMACGVSGSGTGSVSVSTNGKACTHFHVFPGASATTGTIKIS